jgi:hypothetical protein
MMSGPNDCSGADLRSSSMEEQGHQASGTASKLLGTGRRLSDSVSTLVSVLNKKEPERMLDDLLAPEERQARAKP